MLVCANNDASRVYAKMFYATPHSYVAAVQYAFFSAAKKSRIPPKSAKGKVQDKINLRIVLRQDINTTTADARAVV
jgi:hypothetical protein